MKILFLLLLIIIPCFCFIDILDYGAVPNSDTIPDQLRNQKALLAAMKAANVSANDRTVRIPYKKFYSLPVRVEYHHNITIEIIGRWIASKSVRNWMKQPNS